MEELPPELRSSIEDKLSMPTARTMSRTIRDKVMIKAKPFLRRNRSNFRSGGLESQKG
jgi:hypothetical protein